VCVVSVRTWKQFERFPSSHIRRASSTRRRNLPPLAGLYLKFLKLSSSSSAKLIFRAPHTTSRKQIPSFGTFKLPRVRMATAQRIFLFSLAKSPKVRRRGAIFKPLERIIISHSIDSAPKFAFSSSRLARSPSVPASPHCADALLASPLPLSGTCTSSSLLETERSGLFALLPARCPRTRPRLLFESSREFQGVLKKEEMVRDGGRRCHVHMRIISPAPPAIRPPHSIQFMLE
jgi:hypothetical protein